MDSSLVRSYARHVLLTTLVLGIAGCGELVVEPEPKEITDLPRELTASETAAIGASNDFGFRLMGALTEVQAGENIIISPLSASMALGMATNGAAGDTYEAMHATLGFGDLEGEEVNEAYGALISLLRGLDPQVTFDLGNSVWYRDTYDLVPEFAETVREHFDARVEGLDFSDPAARDVMNGWVEEVTAGRITEIVDRIEPLDVVFLINAIYFEGEWTDQFDPERTRSGNFHLADGTTVSADFMEETFEEIPHARTDAFQVAELPYGGGAYAMTLLLPGAGTSVDAAIGSLDPDSWGELLGTLEVGKLHVVMPTFELEWGKLLNDELEEMGMGIAFDDKLADFSRMFVGGEDGYISRVRQKTFVKVDERGTEAAAATGVGGLDSGPPSIRLDRPFLFAIRERFSGTILFLGTVEDPTG